MTPEDGGTLCQAHVAAVAAVTGVIPYLREVLAEIEIKTRVIHERSKVEIAIKHAGIRHEICRAK